jgi:hypothetical protein
MLAETKVIGKSILSLCGVVEIVAKTLLAFVAISIGATKCSWLVSWKFFKSSA